MLVFSLAIVVLILAWSNLRHLPHPGKRATLLALRGGLILALLAVFLQPTWVTEHPTTPDHVVVVLIDGSRSMGHGRRRARAEHIARKFGPNARLFSVGDQLTPLADPTELRAAGGASDLVGGVEAALDRVGVSRVGAVVLISDGLDPQLAGGLSDEARERLVTAGIAIHTIALTDERPVTDLAIAAVRASPFAFVRNTLPVEVDISGRSDKPLTVVALLDGTPVASQRLLPDDRTVRTARMQLQPKSTGAHVLSVAVTALPDEATRANNRVHRPLEVIRDRTRILHLAGHPSWDTRFLRSHLRADPTIDLISFYIMVGRGGGVFVRSEDTTLIPFPTKQLFGEAMADFDLVIFSDFDFAPFGIERFMPRLRKWVAGGGSFLVVGGPEALVSGGYDDSSVAQWLPVKLRQSTDGGWRPGEFTPRLTAIGRAHPITRSYPGFGNWSDLTLEGHNTGLNPRADAAVLIQGPEESPVLTVGHQGRGRTAVFATDSLWTWAFPEREAAPSPRRYHRMLRQLRGWLIRDPDFVSLRLQAETRARIPGDRCKLTATLIGADQRPAAGVQVTLMAGRLPRSQPPVKVATATTDAAGRALFSWIAGRGGPWQLQVSAQHAGTRHTAEVVMAIAEGPTEDLMVQAAPERLRTLAETTGGQHWRNRPEQLPVPTVVTAAPMVTERVALWSRAWVALIILLVLSAEWMLRRSWGLT
ncbi:MAG: hypothetical protein KC502_06340 [Myxococcales bacterium]|nr:hypothetical protein [Myxococcales bacterium]